MRNNTSNTAPPKKIRLNIRASLEQKDALVKAAKIKQTTISDFVLQNACNAAHETIAEEVNFRLPDKQWKAFCKALDAPVKSIATLKKLLLEPGVFDVK